jgi:hypothetical protein
MKNPYLLRGRSNLSLLFGVLALSALALPVRAQTYSIDWYKVAGGGVMNATGGIYAVSGTIAQQDASGPMTGAGYQVTGGFWALYAVMQTPGAPNLRILFATPDSVVVSWPAIGSFTLQTNNNVATPANWAGYSGAVTTLNGTNSVTLTPPPGKTLFFRLE